MERDQRYLMHFCLGKCCAKGVGGESQNALMVEEEDIGLL